VRGKSDSCKTSTWGKAEDWSGIRINSMEAQLHCRKIHHISSASSSNDVTAQIDGTNPCISLLSDKPITRLFSGEH